MGHFVTLELTKGLCTPPFSYLDHPFRKLLEFFLVIAAYLFLIIAGYLFCIIVRILLCQMGHRHCLHGFKTSNWLTTYQKGRSFVLLCGRILVCHLGRSLTGTRDSGCPLLFCAGRLVSMHITRPEPIIWISTFHSSNVTEKRNSNWSEVRFGSHWF